MTLNASGPISLGGSTVGQSINLELGQSATALASINATNFRALAGVSSGQISLSNFYGKSSGTAIYSFSLGISNTSEIKNAIMDSSSNIYYLAANSNDAYAGPGKLTSSNALAYQNLWSQGQFTGYSSMGSTGKIYQSINKGSSYGGYVIQQESGLVAYSTTGTVPYATGVIAGGSSGVNYNVLVGGGVSTPTSAVSGYVVQTGWQYTERTTIVCCCPVTTVRYICTITAWSAVDGSFQNFARTAPTSNIGYPQYARPTLTKTGTQVWMAWQIDAFGLYDMVLLQRFDDLTTPTGGYYYRRLYSGYYKFPAANYTTLTIDGVSSSNALIITGYGTDNATSQRTAYIVKGDSSNTNVAWGVAMYIYGQSGVTSITYGDPQSTCTDASGNIYVSAIGRTSSNNLVSFIFKFNTSGTLQWQRSFAVTSTTAPTYTGGSIRINNLFYNSTTSELIVSCGLQVGTSSPTSAYQGLILRVPDNGTKTGNIVVPMAYNTAYTTTVAYSVSTATVQPPSNIAGTMSFLDYTGTNNFQTTNQNLDTISTTTSALSPTIATGNF